MPCSLSHGGQACSFNGVRIGVDHAGAGGWVRCSAHSLEGAVCRDHAQYPVLLWIPQKWQLGFWSFISCSHFAPAAAFMHLFPSLIVSFYLVVPGDVCPDTSTAAKDPSLSHYLS